jgi:hypothetical protein
MMRRRPSGGNRNLALPGAAKARAAPRGKFPSSRDLTGNFSSRHPGSTKFNSNIIYLDYMAMAA